MTLSSSAREIGRADDGSSRSSRASSRRRARTRALSPGGPIRRAENWLLGSPQLSSSSRRAEAQLVLGSTAFLFVLLGLVAINQLVFGARELAALAGSGCIVALLAPLAYRRGSSLSFVGHLLAGTLFLVVGAGGLLTGARATGLLLLHIALPFVALPGRRRACLLWGSLGAAQVLLLAWYAQSAESFPVEVEPGLTFDTRFQSAFLVVLCGTLLSLLYEGFRESALAARNELAHSELRYRVVSEMTADYIYGLRVREDGSMVPVWATSGFSAITGYEGIELADPDSWMQLIHPVDHPIYRQRLEKLSRGESDEREYRIITKQGDVRWLRTKSRALDDGGRRWVFTASTDITEERAAKDALRESEQRFRSIAEQSPVGIFIVQDERLVFVNPALCEACGYTSEELLSWAPGEYRERLTSPPDRSERKNAPAPTEGLEELRGRHRDGSERWWAVGTRPAPYSGRTATLGVLVDVTENKEEEDRRRQLEARVLEAQKLDSLGVLAGGMAHDFNNLLAAILGNAELTSAHLPSESEASGYVSEIVSATQQASEICRQMLIYAGRAAKSTEPTLLEEVVEECLQLARPTLPRELVFEVELEPSPTEIDADRTQLRQMVLNLLTNAAEAIGESSGTIRLATRKRWVERASLEELEPGAEHREGPHVELSVEDTGAGIDARTRQRVFDPFFSTKEPGRGLGLATVRGIVRGHRGVMRVSSNPGSGSRFEILLPTSAQSPSPSRPDEASLLLGADEAGSGRGGLVLLVDDDSLVRSVAKRMLERLDHRVITASDGERGLEVVRERHSELCLVVLDYAMPQLDGAETLSRVRAIRADLPALMVSGYDQSEIRQRVGEVDLVEFLNKPYSGQQLREKIQRLLACAER